MKRGLNIGTVDGKPFSLPLEFVTRTLAIVAIRGGGKTVAATVLAEEMCEAGLPWIAFDPTPGGVWWGLRCNPDGSPGGYQVVVIGGKHADLPFDRAHARQLAEAFARENICVVVDVSQESKTTWRGFVADFCDRLMELEAGSPRHLFIEEGPEFVPQRPVAEQKRSKAAVDRVIRLGRNGGYGCTILTQRFATVDKDVLTQCENILALRSVGKPDRKAVKDWVAECVMPTPDDPVVETFLDSLPNLPDGEGWFWSPQWLKLFERIKVRQRKTLHPGRTRTLSEAPLRVELSDVRDFVDRFRVVLATPPKVPKAAVTVRQVGPLKLPPEVLATDVVESLAPRLAALESEAARLRGQNADLHRKLGMATAALAAVRGAMEPEFRALQKLFAELDGAQASAGGVDRAPFEAWFPKLRKGARVILNVLLERGPELSIRQLLVLTQRRAGGGWNNDIGQLRSIGLVEKGDPVKLRVP